MLREERHTSWRVRFFPISRVHVQMRTTASGITQRHTNFYDFMIDPEIQRTIRVTVYNL
ncbi:hypothetical protein PISMIDRAFT_690888 [Pisolithus microcarpus 441]|uniref:Unplaced genomic scaffold scaffold_802, whole genome shotgun sequence n=1 Tax=Pisolithus microcarpus 441 TaxID=765257 RepID=A0A0C9Y9G9_9AGAM|nr:hypothetical protein PISMIDRAFT_690888 [Pisolithus microcarpus 441]